GAGAGDVVEIMRQPEIVVAALSFEDVLDRLQHLERKHAADAASVDGQKLLRTLTLNSVLQRHCRLPVCCRQPRRHRALPDLSLWSTSYARGAPAGWTVGCSPSAWQSRRKPTRPRQPRRRRGSPFTLNS